MLATWGAMLPTAPTRRIGRWCRSHQVSTRTPSPAHGRYPHGPDTHLARPGSTARHGTRVQRRGARWARIGPGHPSPLPPKSSRLQCIWIGVRGFHFIFLRQGFCHIDTPIDFEGASLGIRRSSSPRSADHGRLRNVSGQRWPRGGGRRSTKQGWLF